MAHLLPFHTAILDTVCGHETNDLLVIGRGLGLRRLVCTLLKIYDDPRRLILLVNATPEEEAAIGDELGIMGCRRPGLRVITYETPTKERQATFCSATKLLYEQGGLLSVTSRILVVDMLKNDISTALISGMVVLHAERVTALALEAFIVRLYREKNKDGFLKAFTDQPEHITSGLSPLKNVMKELQLRRVHIHPRFQEDVQQSLQEHRADVVEIGQPMTESMTTIHGAILHCMNATLADLKRSNTSLDLDELTIDNAYFRRFEVIVRKQLDPVWHKVGPRTKQLVKDLATLRHLLGYLLTYDAFQFHAYCETLIAAESTSASGRTKQNHSAWMMTDSANIIFTLAKARCYTVEKTQSKAKTVIDLADDEDAWEALDAMEGNVKTPKRPPWLPQEVTPICEELPKWTSLSEILLEIEEEIQRTETMKPSKRPLGNNTVLIMTNSARAGSLITEFLSALDNDAPDGQKGHSLMLRKLRLYLWWKKQLKDGKDNVPFLPPSEVRDLPDDGTDQISEALKRKDKMRAERDKSRRRVRGGTPVQPARKDRDVSVAPKEEEPADFSRFIFSLSNPGDDAIPLSEITLDDLDSIQFMEQFDTSYGLLTPSESVIVRVYSDDSDDLLLAQLKPRFLIMYEPNMDFVRRIEVYRSTHPGYGIRVYHMVYSDSCEEHKYLAGVRKEKDSFEALIKEKATMVLTIQEERREDPGDAIIKTISTRIAGGRRELSTEASQVVVDMREFRSTLPSLLHAGHLLVIPATLTVGDYIITPEMCVERKSLSDLVSSFNSGRLYTQCELMSAHYKYPILLVEFEEDKAFSLDILTDARSFAKPVGKYPKKNTKEVREGEFSPTIQSKLVLLTLSFPRLKIIWSASPYATAEIFRDLKRNNREPDPAKAIAVGAEEDPEQGGGINAAAEDLLRCLPGITTKNVRFVGSQVKSVREFAEMELAGVQKILGNDPGKACWEFMHRGDRKSN
ncbi:hypothetical protein DL96DRAFT_1521655 [Flagelloscypha sp. PMI_526]|nr:hypothetical protein DL96DRAFT_1521655 [Flagelloscypha sp. PMI_526]